MRTNKQYTKEELASMVELVGQGASYKDLAEIFGRSAHAIEQKLNSLGAGTRVIRTKDDVNIIPADATPTPVKEKTLNDFTIREIIYHLYHERSCRFRVRENNRVVVVVEKEINMSDILKGN